MANFDNKKRLTFVRRLMFSILLYTEQSCAKVLDSRLRGNDKKICIVYPKT